MSWDFQEIEWTKNIKKQNLEGCENNWNFGCESQIIVCN